LPEQEFRVTVWDQAGGSTSKVWNWENLLTDIEIGKWYTLFVSWDGTDIKVRFGEVGSISSSAIPVDNKDDDDAVTQIDPGRRILIGPQFSDARMYQAAIWDSDLSQADINFLDSNITHDFLTPEGGYTGTAASGCQHWYRFCLDRTNFDRDYGVAASGTIEIAADGFSDEDDCRIDSPV
jgi:hypothetical protein